MRFIHAADLHIDSPLRGLSRYEGAPLERLRGATRRALEHLVALAIQEKVDFVLIAGDLYDGDWQDFHTGLFVREQMVRLGQAHIRVFIVQGNHDAQSVITRRVPWPDNVTVFADDKAQTVRLDALGVAIHGHSFANRAVPEDLVPGYPAALAGLFNIGVLHTSLGGADGHGTYAPTSLSMLQTKGYDYWALGHVHARQVVCEQPRVVFSGNLQGRHARETGPKGCELVEVQGAVLVQARFVPLDVVRWHQLEIELQPTHTLEDLSCHITQALQNAVTHANAGEALHAMRVLLTGQTPLHTVEAEKPGTLAAAVQAAAQDAVGAQIWIEKVKLNLRSPLNRAQLAQGQNALAELVRGIDQLGANPQALADFCNATLLDVLSKIPAEMSEGDSGDIPSLENPAALLSLLQDAEATLLARLNPSEVR